MATRVNRVRTPLRILPFLSLAAVAIGIGACAEQSGAADEGAPRIHIVDGDTVNWGDVGGGDLKYALKIVNAGGDTLRIEEVKPSCGCTTAPLDKNVLLSGDTAIVQLTMDVKGKMGEQMKSLRITTNDSIDPVKTVWLRANVLQDLVAEPTYFPSISNVKPGEQGTSTIVLKNSGKEVVTIQPPELLDKPLMVIQFDMTQPRTLKPGDSTEVTASASALNDGITATNVLFKTTSKLTPELKLNLTINTNQSTTGAIQQERMPVRREVVQEGE